MTKRKLREKTLAALKKETERRGQEHRTPSPLTPRSVEVRHSGRYRSFTTFVVDSEIGRDELTITCYDGDREDAELYPYKLAEITVRCETPNAAEQAAKAAFALIDPLFGYTPDAVSQ